MLSIIIFWTIFFTVTFVMYILYEKCDIAGLIKPFSYFDTYPYICKKCMTTWSLIAAYIMAAVLMNDPLFGFFGVILGGLYGYGLNKIEEERTVTYEDNK